MKKYLFVFMAIVFVQSFAVAQCLNTNQNPSETILAPNFGGYDMVVSNSITAGDYFLLRTVNNHTYTLKSSNPDTYINVYWEGELKFFGPAPLNIDDLDNGINLTVHVNSISPPCGEDMINRTISIECTSCYPHGGVGIGTNSVSLSAALEVDGMNGVLLLPRIDEFVIEEFPSFEEGSIFYNTSSKRLNFHTDNGWEDIFGGTDLLENPSDDVEIQVNSTRNVLLGGTNGSKVGIGTESPFSPLHVMGDPSNGSTAPVMIENTGGLKMLIDGNDILSLTSPLFLNYHNNQDISLADGGGRTEWSASSGNIGMGLYPSFSGPKLQVKGDFNNGSSATFSIESGNEKMLFDGNEIDAMNNTLSLNANSTEDIHLANGGGQTYWSQSSGTIGMGTIPTVSGPKLQIQGSDNNGSTATLSIKSSSQTLLLDGNEIDSDSPIGLYLNNNSNNDVIMAAGGGRVGIEETNPSAMLHIKQAGSGEEGLAIENDTDADTWAFEVGANDMHVYFNGTEKARIDDADGSWDMQSDRRLKRNIEYIPKGTLEKILALKPATYQYKDNPADAKKSIGFIAQEVQEIFPELVNDGEGEFLSLSYHEFAVLAIKAVQEQEAKIESLIKRLEILEKLILK